MEELKYCDCGGVLDENFICDSCGGTPSEYI